MPAPTVPSPHPGAEKAAAPAKVDAKVDKRAAILAAALRLIARSGLHNTPMSALAQEAGVGAGTVYRYFPSKEAMINALYLELVGEQDRATKGQGASPAEPAADGSVVAPRELLWRAWHGLARWHLDHPEASNLIQQCRASGILTEATRATEQRLEAAGLAEFDAAVARGLLRPVSRHVLYALFAGPIAALVRMRDAGELDVDDPTLRATFEGVSRSLLPAPAAPAA